MYLKQIGINMRNWVNLAQDRDYWRALVNEWFHKPWSQLVSSSEAFGILLVDVLPSIKQDLIQVFFGEIHDHNFNRISRTASKCNTALHVGLFHKDICAHVVLRHGALNLFYRMQCWFNSWWGGGILSQYMRSVPIQYCEVCGQLICSSNPNLESQQLGNLMC